MMRTIARGPTHRVVLIAIVAVVVLSTNAAAQTPRRLQRVTGDERRVALVIGNNRYPSMPLSNASNDATAVAGALRRLGFEVQVANDTTFKGLSQAVDRFVATLRTGDVALAYYAGHGIQIDGENFLVPVDFDAKDGADAKYEAGTRLRLRMDPYSIWIR